VGQGDAALLTLPDNTTILIDGGGRPGPFQRETDGNDELREPEHESRGIGESVVSEYLWWRGLDRIDYLVATHADADHIDGLNDVVRNFKVRAILVARSPARDPEFTKLAQTLASRNVPVRIVGAADVLQVGEVSLEVLSPMPSADTHGASRNDDSMVLHLQFGKRTILLTGDIEARAETALVRHYNRSLAADLTKVAHHGSKTSSTENFVAAVGSRVAVVSVGESSVFGHPHSEVVERWKSSGAQVLTTGKNGMITLITDGHNVELKTFVNPRDF
jgi:competence protein ComEC